MSVRGRVGRLERGLGLTGSCPLCRGRGAPAFEVRWEGEGPRPDHDDAPPPREHAPCPRCGRVALTRIVIGYVDRTGAGTGAGVQAGVRATG